MSFKPAVLFGLVSALCKHRFDSEYCIIYMLQRQLFSGAFLHLQQTSVLTSVCRTGRG